MKTNTNVKSESMNGIKFLIHNAKLQQITIQTESLIPTSLIGCKGSPVLGIFISILLKVEASASADLRANLRDVLRIKIIELSYLII